MIRPIRYCVSLLAVLGLSAPAFAGQQTRDASDSAPPPDRASSADQTSAAPPSSPLAIHVGDADLLIGGFMDATVVTRSTNPGSGIGTSFGSIPFTTTAPGAQPGGNLSETRFSAQNSRLTLQATSKVGKASLKGYLEADFLGNRRRTSTSRATRTRSACASTGRSSPPASSSSSPASRGAC